MQLLNITIHVFHYKHYQRPLQIHYLFFDLSIVSQNMRRRVVGCAMITIFTFRMFCVFSKELVRRDQDHLVVCGITKALNAF